MKDLYKTLGVLKEDSERTIYRAFVKQAYPLHPNNPKGKSTDREQFLDFCKAYYVLGHPESRIIYDEILDKAEGHRDGKLALNETNGYRQRFKNHGEEYAFECYHMSFSAFKKNINKPTSWFAKVLESALGILNQLLSGV